MLNPPAKRRTSIKNCILTVTFADFEDESRARHISELHTWPCFVRWQAPGVALFSYGSPAALVKQARYIEVSYPASTLLIEYVGKYSATESKTK